MIWHFFMIFNILYIDGSTQICNGPLGMINGDIRDWQITASSTRRESDCHEKNGRLYQSFDRAWCARQKSDSEWLQIDLGIAAKISGVLTQGRANKEEYVTSFMISYSIDAYQWQYLVDQYGNQKIFSGNKNAYSIRNNYFDEVIIARFIKFHPIQWYSHPSLRVEIIGCQECKQHLGLPPYGKIRASTIWPSRRRASCQAEDGYLMSNKGCKTKPNVLEHDQWLEFDLGHPSTVTSLITKGRGDTKYEQWVTKYRVSISNDTRLWIYYKDKSQMEPKEFAANNDRDSERIHFLNEPFFSRYVRLHPVEWHNHVSMRAAILGCPHQGTCSPGYFRVNNEAQCIENMAYKKQTWTNGRKRNYRKHRIGGGPLWNIRETHSDTSLAVDGLEQPLEWSNCATIDNYFVEKPIWMVDIGRKTNIAGVMLRTWHGNKESNSSSSISGDHFANLDRYNVYIDHHPRRHRFKHSNLCSSLARTDQPLISSTRLHFQCQRSLYGRYVYIEAVGAGNRWNKLFTAALCEVFVYEQ